jgi:hypothetical protein
MSDASDQKPISSEAEPGLEPGQAAGSAWAWTLGRLAWALAGGWLAIGLMAGILHVVLGDLSSIDLGAIVLAASWALVIAFVAATERLGRRRG